VSEQPRFGRVEAGLNRELAERRDIGPAERSALREQARAVDMAARAYDPHLVSEANRAYLDLRQAAGLTSAGTRPVDAFDTLMAEIGRAGSSASHPPEP
jgi:hypothetical protein